MKKVLFVSVLLAAVSALLYFSYHFYFSQNRVRNKQSSPVKARKVSMPEVSAESKNIITNLEKFRKAVISNDEETVEGFIEFPIDVNWVNIWTYSRDISADSVGAALLKEDYLLNKNEIFSDVFKKLLKKIDFNGLKENNRVGSVIKYNDGNTYSMEVKIQSLSNNDIMDGICFEVVNDSDAYDNKYYDSIVESNNKSIHKYFWVAQHFFKKDMKGNLRLSYINIM
ncbi:hypothetical protein [uncultured Chryseobacterium sp.]|uniref:hypothetical protein n=1 Tax=uncultured Chryseobacterium sp. TaxID=259322 RepID=UPI0025F8FFF6|nr:hypothetical protein [uncultured Chryseobacterium sp.]